MTHSLSVCSWNIGKDVNDYHKHLLHHNPTENEVSITEYHKTQKAAAQYLTNKQSADVYCLQEVYSQKKILPDQSESSDRFLIDVLKKSNYEIVRYSPNADNVIALDTNRFKNISGWSFPSLHSYRKTWDIAIAATTDKLTNQEMIFISAHIPGFDLDQDKVSIDSTKKGDLICHEIVEKIKLLSKKSAYQIVAADMNVYPEKFPGRFKIFEDAELIMHRTGSATNVNPSQKNNSLRELDYFFVRGSNIKIGNQDGNNLTVQNGPFEVFGWDLNINPSDHLPIKMTFKIPQKFK